MNILFQRIDAPFMCCTNDKNDEALIALVNETAFAMESDILAERLKPVHAVALPISKFPTLLVPVVRKTIHESLVTRGFEVSYVNINGDEIMVGPEYQEDNEDEPYRSTDGLEKEDSIVVSWKENSASEKDESSEEDVEPPTKKSKK